MAGEEGQGLSFPPLPEDLAAYLRKPGFDKLLQAVKGKYESLNRVGGTVRLASLTPEERDTLEGFVGRKLGEPASITLAEADEGLRQSRWGLTLEELLRGYFGRRLQPKPLLRQERQKRWKELFTHCLPQAVLPVREWLEGLQGGRMQGYRTLAALFREDPKGAEICLGHVAEALNRLLAKAPETVLRLPVFAAEVTGDPHAFDRDSPLGRLFFAGLQHFYGEGERDFSMAGFRKLLGEAGLEGDDISSFVTVFGLATAEDDPLAPLMQGAKAAGEPLNLTLRTVQRAPRWRPVGEGRVFAVENPAVFSSLLDRRKAGMDPPPLICTSGQLSSAAQLLLDQLAAAGFRIHYSGDLDPAGLAIAWGLRERYGEAFAPWRMDIFTYNGVRHKAPMTGEQRAALDRLDLPWDRALLPAMRKEGALVYQEAFLDLLAGDWLGGGGE